MSLRPGLLASSSRLANPLGARAALPAARLVRAASNQAAPASKAKGGSSVQKADQQLKDLERARRRMPPGMELDFAIRGVLMEQFLDKRFNPVWLFKKGQVGYLWNRMQRHITSARFAAEATEKGIFPPEPEVSLLKRLAGWFKFSLTKYAATVVPELEQTYYDYYRAQASGDAKGVRAVSTGPAEDRALKVAQSIRGAKWSLVKVVKAPRVRWVRRSPVDMQGKLVLTQVAVQFDTEQALTTADRPPKRKEMRIQETVVFELKEVSGEKWRLKDTQEEQVPEYVSGVAHTRY
ncbi:hypothetical protein Q8F55_006885 [Vanrija albida]|uniref:Tim44-like domain-containing protein n=1 Tax=Vanrija albida TaxID=181172 RepID=A0ABR3PZ58_9TREE